MDWLTATIGGGAGLFGQAIGGLFGRANQKYQNEWNLEMWRRQNEYNSPIQQMARYQEAGLNPNLIYSQGSPGNSQSMPTSAENKYHPDMSFVGNALMQGMQSEQMQHQNEVYRADAMDKKASAILKSNEAILVQLKSVEQQLNNKYLDEKNRIALEQQKATLNATLVANAQALENLGVSIEAHDEIVRSYGVKNDNTEADTNKKKSETDYIKTEINYYPQLVGADINLKQAQAGYYKALMSSEVQLLLPRISELAAKADNLDQNTRNQHAQFKNLLLDGDIKELEKALKQEDLDTYVVRFWTNIASSISKMSAEQKNAVANIIDAVLPL